MRPASSEPPRGSIRIAADAAELAELAAGLVAAELRDVLARRGRVHWALAGGSTPLAAYRGLARLDLDWSRVEVYWGDERCVDPTDEASNYRAARSALLDPIGMPGDRVHRIRGELGPVAAARDYEARLRRRFEGPWPELDLILLGVGTDGHTASLFPGDEHEPGRWASAACAPDRPRDRVTLTYPVLAAARHVVFLASGPEKAEPVARARREVPPELPAARVAASARHLTWWLDSLAAGVSDPGGD